MRSTRPPSSSIMNSGGLSGATPGEAVTWGKVDPGKLPDMIVCYLDNSVALPLLTAHALSRRKRRPLRRLYDRLGELTDELERQFWANSGKLPT